MPFATVEGLKVAYELYGDGEPVAITPGGRFGKDTAGIRELALALAEGGKRALIWDRPNTGSSDLCFDGPSESIMHADTLAGLIRALGLGRTSVVGGSAGARVSLLTVVRHPDVVDKLAMWLISGGFFGPVRLALYYFGDAWEAAIRSGMEGVLALPSWQESLAANPAAGERLLAMDPEEFARKMEAWGTAFLPGGDTPIAGLSPSAFAEIRAPTLVFRSSATDTSHPRRTSEWLHELIPASRLVEPPWGDDEWRQRLDAYQRTGVNALFESWPKLAPQLLDFVSERFVA
jgi:pimeloyl-ACP methyl ester carboxylesterase